LFFKKKCKNIAFAIAGIFTVFSQQKVNAELLYSEGMGSYLFCVNKKDSTQWQWAKPNLNPKYSWAPYDESGYWIKGSLWIAQVLDQSLHTGFKIHFDDEEKPKPRNTRDVYHFRNKVNDEFPEPHHHVKKRHGVIEDSQKALNDEIYASESADYLKKLESKELKWFETISEEDFQQVFKNFVIEEKKLHHNYHLSRQSRESIHQIEQFNKSKLKEYVRWNYVCRELINTCTNSFGPDYDQVGVASWSIAATDWGFIKAGDQICSNWKYKHGLALGSGWGIHLDEILTGAALDLVTGGPTKEPSLEVLAPGNIRPKGGIPPARGVVEHPVTIGKRGSSNNVSGNVAAKPKPVEVPTKPRQAASKKEAAFAKSEVEENNNVPGFPSLEKTKPNSEIDPSDEDDTPFEVVNRKKPEIPHRAKYLTDTIDFSKNEYKRFWNNEGKLPTEIESNPKSIPEYYEMDIQYQGQQKRDAKRVVFDKTTGKRWFTNNHYASFKEMTPVTIIP
jgi:guanyl-specific ribonuclease Sa